MSDSENTADIVARLRDWRSLHLTRLGELFDEAADEIERLRSRPCPYVTGAVTQHCTLTPFTLTDAEREAVADGVRCVEYVAAHGQPARADLASSAATLRGLLNRLSPIKTAECDRPKPIATPEPQSTPAECSVATERT